MLPDGIAFGDETGTVVFSNIVMNDLCRRISGENLSDSEAFWHMICEKGEERNGDKIIVTDTGEAVMFTGTFVTDCRRKFRQILAFDVTGLQRITSDLEKKNEKLVDIQLRMKAYQAQASDVIISKEIMKARAQVHDELGHVLLSAGYYFENPDQADASVLYSMLKRTNQLLLREAEEPDDMDHDSISDALKIVSAIGVKVDITGEMPEKNEEKDLAGRVIRECAFNAVKHAGGDKLDICFYHTDESFTVSVTNNGEPPREEIIETGGLLALRRSVEEYGGEMNISAADKFMLTIVQPV
ncbi:MAG: hypothetical protein IJL67_04255 [Oscillospiraceae bacterium]|nr:hypothetical protein [Oscillospiraceae bacterium]